jgi:transposase
MISPELRARIRRLFFAEHWKIGTIASELGVHRLDEPAQGRVPMAAAKKKETDLPPVAEAADTPACSEAQVVARRLGAQGRSVMRSVGLDLGARHIAYCEVANGQVVARATFRSFAELERRLGPETPEARVAFEACREGWHVDDTLRKWGKEPVMLDTTRVRQIGVGQHGRKNDALDAEAIAMALDSGRVPVAHVLSAERRELRAKLSIRGELVDLRARQVTVLRGLARAAGVLLPTSRTEQFLQTLERAPLDAATRALMAPLVATLKTAQEQITLVEDELVKLAKKDPMVCLCASAPGVGLVIATTFVSVIDDAKRFRNAHAVGAYLGLVPSENTTGGKQRLGGITKHGNSQARAMLVQAAWQIIRVGDKDDPLRRWATHIAKVRGKKIAVVALARKLAGVLWAMCRTGTFYDAAFQARESTKGLKTDAQSAELRAQAMARTAQKFQRRERKATTSSPSPRAKTSRVNAM